MENPWASPGLGIKSFFLLEIVMFLGLLLGWGGARVEGTSLQLNESAIYLFLFSALPGLLGVLVLLLVLRKTIIFISANDRHIALKFASGRIKKLDWKKLLDIRVGGRRGTYVALDNYGTNYAFNLNSVRGSVHYYEKAARKRVHRV